MEKVTTSDLYLAAYIVLHGHSIDAIECVPVNKAVTCNIVFIGPKPKDLEAEYFARNAVANLYSFRMAYNQVSSFIHTAKQTYTKQRRAEKLQQQAELAGGQG